MSGGPRLPPGHERYLGDGVYATWDGYQVVLDLRGQDDSRIALEPYVLERLFNMAADALGGRYAQDPGD